MKRTFKFEFEEEKANTLTYEYSLAEDEKLSSSVEHGVPTIYANRSALLTLAKLLIKMGAGAYTGGFHVHLHKDFNSELPDCLTVVLDEPSRTNQEGKG